MSSSHHPRHASSMMRYCAESLVLLGVVVTIFRGFATEGYMISTGSMAPTLLGYHRQVECADCHFRFSRSVSPTDEADASALAAADPGLRTVWEGQLACPLCGHAELQFQRAPETHGDQLLVHKLAYEFRDPHRWEVVVFGNPGDPRQAYVKRVVGLPGESVEVRDGEVFANGKLCRKPLDVQRAVAIPVAEFALTAQNDDPDWRSGWLPANPDSGWGRQKDVLRFNPLRESTLAWLAYEHWIRTGGDHETAVPLTRWPERVPLPEESLSNLIYRDGELHCRGAFTNYEVNRWAALTDDQEFATALEQLFRRSHLAPVTSELVYNPVEGEVSGFPVNDFLLSFDLQNWEGTGTLVLELTDGNRTIQAIFSADRQRMELWSVSRNELLGSARWTPPLPGTTQRIEFSLMDDQALVAVNGRELLPAVPFPPAPSEPVSIPVRLGGQGATFELAGLKLSRDLIYTEKERTTATLGPDEFFVLGDNSAVSVDSRSWPTPGVPRKSLIGKPLFVHLPSRQAAIDWHGASRNIRVPDFSRVRVIR